MLDPDVDRADRANPAEDYVEPDVRARQARRRRLLLDALERTRANDPDWLDVSATSSRAGCELSRDLGDQPAPAPFTRGSERRSSYSSRPVPGT